MRIVNYYPGALGSSGVTVALWEWAGALSDAGIEVCVLHGGGTSDGPSLAFGEFRDRDLDVGVEFVRHAGNHRLVRRPIDLNGHLRPGDVLVLHEGWVTANMVAARAATRASVPYLVMPHGVYKPLWRRYLKPPRLVREAFERGVLERARAVHVFFASEALDVRALAPRARTIVVPTGFSRQVAPWEGGGGYLAWVGRYDPHHKGLDLLVDALSMLSPGDRPHIILRGYNYRGGQELLQAQIARQKLGDWIEVGGLIQGAEKLEFLRLADGYLHPSRWESQSMALLETLAIGVPTLATSSMEIAGDLKAANAAVVVEPTATSIAQGIPELVRSRDVLSQNGRNLVATAFSWSKLIPQYLNELERLGLS